MVVAVQDCLNYNTIMTSTGPDRDDADAFLVDVEGAIREGIFSPRTPQGPALQRLSARSLDRAAAASTLAPGAKRARARLCLALGQAAGVDRATLVGLAAAVEMIHAASLLHDDVVDVADRRRNLPTVNRVEGNSFAVLAGDVLLTRALCVVGETPHGHRQLVAALQTIEDMTRAALLEVDARGTVGDPAETVDVWRHMAAGKTGALFGLVATLVLQAAGDDGVIRPDLAGLPAAFSRLGVAFQIIDDLKDLAGADEGKPRGQDPRERALNHPLLLAAARSPAVATQLQQAWAMPPPLADDVVDALCENGLVHGAIPALAEARGIVDEATVALRAADLPTDEILGFAEALLTGGVSILEASLPR